MTIYYGRFLEANKIIATGGIHTEFFNSKEAIFEYKNMLRSIGIDDILEAIGEMEFNKKGHLVTKDGSEQLLYDPDKEEFDRNENEDDDEDED